MDYEEAKARLDLITSEAGWYVYCYEEEQWHLYNDDEQLLFTADTIEELVEKHSGIITYGPHNNITNKLGYWDVNPPIQTDHDGYTRYEDK